MPRRLPSKQSRSSHQTITKKSLRTGKTKLYAKSYIHTLRKGFHTEVVLNSQKAHEPHPCEMHHLHHALQWPNIIAGPILSKENLWIFKPRLLYHSPANTLNSCRLTLSGLSQASPSLSIMGFCNKFTWGVRRQIIHESSPNNLSF